MVEGKCGVLLEELGMQLLLGGVSADEVLGQFAQDGLGVTAPAEKFVV